MRWHDFDRNGKIDGRDYFLMDLLLNPEEEEIRMEISSMKTKPKIATMTFSNWRCRREQKE